MKLRKILSLIIDTLIIGMIIFSFIFVLLILKMNIVTLSSWFTFIISISLLLISSIDLILNIRFLLTGKVTNSKAIYVLKLMVSSSSLVLFLSVLCYLQYNIELYNNPNFLFINLILHYICPILFSIGFIFLETDSKHKFIYILFSPLLVLLYFAYVIPLVLTNVLIDPYGFINFTSSTWINNVLICLLYVVLSLFLSIVLYALNYIFYMIYGEGVNNKEKLIKLDLSSSQIIVNEDKSKSELINEDNNLKPVIHIEDNLEKENLTEENQSVNEDEKDNDDIEIIKNEDEEIVKSTKRGKIYHITYRSDDGVWSVKLEKGKRALKLFKTQAEAISYAKELMKNQEASFRVHSLKGKIRKI